MQPTPKRRTVEKRSKPSIPLTRTDLKKIRTRLPSSSRSKSHPKLLSKDSKLSRKKQKYRINPTGRFGSELTCLQEHWQPGSMHYRDNEKNRIESFIKEGLDKKGSSTALYITGLPGLGKTAAVFEVVSRLLKSKIFDFYYINALKLSCPSGFYSKLWSDLTDVDELPPKACKFLDGYFRSKHLAREYESGSHQSCKTKLKNTKVLVVDEIDFLKNKKQDVLYNLFEWQHSKHSHLIIICIANTLNFHSILLPKIQSRMGNNVLVFKPYTSAEIEGILVSRLRSSNIFKNETLKFIAKKVANFSSDIRKSLHVARRALQLFISDRRGKEQIDVEFVNDVFETEAQKPLIAYIQAGSSLFKIFLISLLYEFKFKNKTIFDTETLFSRMNEILSQINSPKLDFQMFSLVLERCRELKIVKVNYEGLVRPRVEFVANPDDVGFALRNDDVFNRFGPLRSIYEM